VSPVPPARPPGPVAPGARPAPAPERRAPVPAPAPPPGDSLWTRIVDEIRRVRVLLATQLADAVVLKDEGSRLVVALPNGADTAMQDMLRQYRQQVIDAARRVRPDLRDVQFTAALPPAAAGGGAGTTDPRVQVAVELFDGEVTELPKTGEVK
jgi:hypothetical protein